MKKNCFFLFGLLFLTISCNKSDKVSIGFMVPNFIEARYAIDRDNFTAKCVELGAEVLVENANNDDMLQIQQASDLIAKGVKVLVMIPVNANTAAQIVRDAHEKGVKVIAYERLIRNAELDYFVSFDHYVVGKLQATYALSKFPSGNYALICGDKTDNNAVLIRKGQMEVLDASIKSGKIKIIYDCFIEDWNSDGARVTMNNILKLSGTNIDVVLSANDGMAGGIIEALVQNSLAGKILVTGLDAELPACRRIIEGSQAITIYKPLKQQATIAADVAIKLAKGEKSSEATTTTYNGKVDVPTVSILPTLVDASNMKQTIIADGFHKENEVYK